MSGIEKTQWLIVRFDELANQWEHYSCKELDFIKDEVEALIKKIEANKEFKKFAADVFTALCEMGEE